MTLDELLVELQKLGPGNGTKDVVYESGGDGQISFVNVIDETEFIKPDESVGHLPPQIILSDKRL